MARLRKCPFCRKEVEDGYPLFSKNELMNKWVLHHWCEEGDGVFITVSAATEHACIDKWNGVNHEEVEESEST